jgi:hypothetical protein
VTCIDIYRDAIRSSAITRYDFLAAAVDVHREDASVAGVENE